MDKLKYIKVQGKKVQVFEKEKNLHTAKSTLQSFEL
jgi:hypothetical protein